MRAVNPIARGRAIHVPEPVWGRLASLADDRGVQIEDLLTAAIISITQPQTVREQILQMVRAGLPDAVIADHIGYTLSQVAVVRRSAKLPANSMGRGGGGLRRAS